VSAAVRQWWSCPCSARLHPLPLSSCIRHGWPALQAALLIAAILSDQAYHLTRSGPPAASIWPVLVELHD